MADRELVERILNDPALRTERPADPQYTKAAAGLMAELDGLVPDLARFGLPLDYVQDLYLPAIVKYDEQGNEVSRRPVDYRAAVPVLLKWLPEVRYFPVAESIVRAVSVRFAKKQAVPVLLRVFRDLPPVKPEQRREVLRTSIGSALGNFADASIADELIDLAQDRSLGAARAGIVNPGLPKTKDPRVPDVLLSLLDDPAVAPYAVQSLGRLRHAPARPQLEQALTSPDENVRAQAKKALKRLG